MDVEQAQIVVDVQWIPDTNDNHCNIGSTLVRDPNGQVPLQGFVIGCEHLMRMTISLLEQQGVSRDEAVKTLLDGVTRIDRHVLSQGQQVGNA